MTAIYLLLVCVPLAAIGHWLAWSPTWVFLIAMLGIVPLAKAMGQATEEIALRTGPGIGALLNATFGNATELIIALAALHAGLYGVVQASLTGSIIGNILFVLGMSFFLGGLKYPHQYFNRSVASLNTSLLTLAAIGLLAPAGFAFTANIPDLPTSLMQRFSLFVAALLIVAYIAHLIFALKTHPQLYVTGDRRTAEPADLPSWSMGRACGVLAVSTILVAGLSELLVNAIEPVTHALGLSQLFIGVILLPIVGNAAEHLTAVTMALKNKMDLGLGIAIGSSTQIALFVAPALVIAGWLMHRPLTLGFDPFEVLSVAMAVAIANFITLDGESNWLEGLMLLVTYAILAAAFFFRP